MHVASGAFGVASMILLRAALLGDNLEVITLRTREDSLRYVQNSRWVLFYGYWRTLFLQLAFPDALDIIGRIHKDVIQDGTLHAATLTRDAMCARYNMMAVAAAIIAQVAISGLGLGEIANTHWTVQAAFIVSLVSGLLSVYYCCIIQQHFGSLVSPDDIKDWLCTPGEWHGMEKELQEQFASLRPGNETTGTKEQLQTLGERVLARLQSDRWVSPSINSAVMLVAPARLLNLAVSAFLIGLGIYLGLVFTKDINIAAGNRGNLANMIIYILVVVICILLFWIPVVLRLLQRLPRQRVKREAYYIKLMLDTYKELEHLKELVRRHDGRRDSPDLLSEVNPRLENVQDAIMKIRDNTSALSPEAIQDLTVKLREIAGETGQEISRSGANSGAHSLLLGKLWGNNIKRSGSLHQQSSLGPIDRFLDAGHGVQGAVEIDNPDNSNKSHKLESEKNTASQQRKTEISTQLSPIIQALENSTTKQARAIELLEQLVSSARSEEKSIEQVVSHFASAVDSGPP